MRIEWILEDFSLQEIDTLIEKIMPIKNVVYNQRCFICKNKFGFNKLENALMQNYYIKNKNPNLPDNLIYQSLCNFISEKDVWQDFNDN